MLKDCAVDLINIQHKVINQILCCYLYPNFDKMTEIRAEEEGFLVESDTRPIIENENTTSANKEQNGEYDI